MPVVSLVLELRFAGCITAKQKSNQAEVILAKLRRHFNICGTDLSRGNETETTALGFAAVARTRREAREILERVADAVAAHPRAEILKAAFDEL